MGDLDLIALITIAFLGSIGHCSGMCGGFVIAYTSAKVDEKWKKTYQALSHMLYNLGRATSYAVLGAIFGFLGSVVSVGMTAKGILFIIIGFIMVLMGLSLMGKIKFLSHIESSIAETNFFKRSFRALLEKQTLGSFYFLGILNGFIPCGFVYFFLAGAVATASPVAGAVVMFIFGLATIPILFSLGFVVGFLKSGQLRHLMMKASAIMVILFGLFMMFKASMLLSGKMPMKGMNDMSIEKIVKQPTEREN
jgi:sulfite exporter TauE/SafE